MDSPYTKASPLLGGNTPAIPTSNMTQHKHDKLLDTNGLYIKISRYSPGESHRGYSFSNIVFPPLQANKDAFTLACLALCTREGCIPSPFLTTLRAPV
jgi:hypothetical protein